MAEDLKSILPEFEPDKQSWERILASRELDVQLNKTIRELPEFEPAVNTWDNIVRMQKRMHTISAWFTYTQNIAATITLICLCYALLNKSVTVNSFTEEMAETSADILNEELSVFEEDISTQELIELKNQKKLVVTEATQNLLTENIVENIDGELLEGIDELDFYLTTDFNEVLITFIANDSLHHDQPSTIVDNTIKISWEEEKRKLIKFDFISDPQLSPEPPEIKQPANFINFDFKQNEEKYVTQNNTRKSRIKFGF
jgi:hypothetical protein